MSFRALSFEKRRIPCVVLTVKRTYALQSSQYERIFHFFFQLWEQLIDRNFRRQVLVDSPIIYVRQHCVSLIQPLKII